MDRGDDLRTEVVVRPVEPSDRPAARLAAERLGLPLVEAHEAAEGAARPPSRAVLEVGTAGLALRLGDGPLVRVAPGELTRRPAGGRDLLLRAVGRLEAGAYVVDATAGLGADAFHLAAHGVRVVMIERVPVVAALLDDALSRARQGHEGEVARHAAERLTLLQGDARALLRGLDPAPAVVVLDPMYPDSRKRSLPGKGMALFRTLVGGDRDAAALLEVALEVARKRVAVKRPRRASPLGGDRNAARPSGSVVGTTTRYDLYAPRSGST